MTTVLCDLPFEMVVHILSFLSTRDLLQISSTNSVFHNAVSSVYISRRLQQLDTCTRISDLTELEEVQLFTFAEVRRSLFENYGFIVGTWTITSTCYGGLIHVKFDGFKLVGVRYLPPPYPHILQPLRLNKVFVIQVNQSGECQCVCYRGHNGPHCAYIQQVAAGHLTITCVNSELHAHKDGEQAEFSLWLCEELGIEKKSRELHVLTALHRRKFETLRQHEQTLSLSRLLIPVNIHQQPVVIQPGLFKGTYGDHGIELVFLTYNEDNSKAVITKVTGDPNIPATKVSITVDLTKHLWLTEEQQYIPEDPSFFGTPAELIDTAVVQPFRLPLGYVERVNCVPSTCIARYQSEGQIAATGYQDPQFINGHFAVFDADTFGHIWISLQAFSMYSRVTESVLS